MKSLTKKEIQEELRRLGILNTSDIKNFLSEYKSYCSSRKEKDESACESAMDDIEDG